MNKQKNDTEIYRALEPAFQLDSKRKAALEARIRSQAAEKGIRRRRIGFRQISRIAFPVAACFCVLFAGIWYGKSRTPLPQIGQSDVPVIEQTNLPLLTTDTTQHTDETGIASTHTSKTTTRSTTKKTEMQAQSSAATTSTTTAATTTAQTTQSAPPQTTTTAIQTAAATSETVLTTTSATTTDAAVTTSASDSTLTTVQTDSHTVTVQIPSYTATPGETVRIPVYLTGNADVLGLYVSFRLHIQGELPQAVLRTETIEQNGIQTGFTGSLRKDEEAYYVTMVAAGSKPFLSGTFQVLAAWIEFTVPADAPAGEYCTFSFADVKPSSVVVRDGTSMPEYPVQSDFGRITVVSAG